VVIGLAPVDGSINLPIEEKDALSDFYLLRVEPSHKFEYLSLLELIPHTGRTHQLRIHCKESGFPVLGDSLYSVEGMELKAKGLFLSSVRVSFVHPFTKEKLSFEIPPPEKFNKFMLHEKKRYIMNLT
jgi:23S rRNA pseudouridine1911/1915/1917 synthase